MLDNISYRPTQAPEPKKQKTITGTTKLANISETLIKLANLANSPICCETILIIELNKPSIDLDKILSLMNFLPEIQKEYITYIKYNMVNDLNVNYAAVLKTITVKHEEIWIKYHEDIKFSIKVEKYLQQLNLTLKEETKFLQRCTLADS